MEAWKAQHKKKYFDHNHPTLKVVPGRTTLLGLTTDQQSDQQSDRQICTFFLFYFCCSRGPDFTYINVARTQIIIFPHFFVKPR